MSDVIRDMDRLTEAVSKMSLEARADSIASRRRRNPEIPAAAWTARTVVQGNEGTAIAIVLSTIGCSHARDENGGCTMCSYLLDGTEAPVTADDLVKQFRTAMMRVSDADGPLSVKLYTSGSFLDPEEVPPQARGEILQLISSDSRVQHVVIESRPEFVIEDAVVEVRQALPDVFVEIGMGLESSNDVIRLLCLNKGFTRAEFISAVETARRHGIGTRAYVLLKPPFLTEQEALTDAVETMQDAAEMGVTTVSVNPVNIQRHTLVSQLWSRGAYRPPWLWTVVEALQRARMFLPVGVRIECDPVAGGTHRGAHNCGDCDGAALDAIRRFSLTQDLRTFDGLDCHCRPRWHHVLEHEGASLVVHY